MRTFLKSLVGNRNGATAIEYGLIAGLIAVVLVSGIGLVTTGLTNSFTGVGSTLTANAPAA